MTADGNIGGSAGPARSCSRRRLLLSGEARAQSSGGGLPNLFGNIFSGRNPATPAQAAAGARRERRARCPGAARTAPPAIR